MTGLLPKGGTLVLGGEAKIGKSFLALDLAHSLVTGTNFLNDPRYQVKEPARVLYVEQELGEWGIAKRLHDIYEGLGQPGPEGLHVASRVPVLLNEAGVATLGEMVDQTDSGVLMLDPISRLVTADENSNGEVAKVFHLLDQLRETRPELGIILCHHFSKPPREGKDADPLSPYNFRGASNWFGHPDTLLTARTQGKDYKKLKWPGELWQIETRWTVRHGPPPSESDEWWAIMEKDFQWKPTTKYEVPDKPKGGAGAPPPGFFD